MPCFDVTLDLPCFTISKASDFNPIVHDLLCHHVPRCPHCGARDLRKKDKILRGVWHESVGYRRVFLRFFVCKYRCRCCGRYFRRRLDGVRPWQRSTEVLNRQIYHLHKQGISRKTLAREYRKSESTNARYYDHMYTLENRKLMFVRISRILRQSGFEDCYKLGKTLENWQEEIARMWRFSRSNGITEGYHRKMKLIQRRAFGFRNFENYRRRVRALCA